MSVFSQPQIIPGAERMDVYVPFLKGKAVALFANQTSMVSDTHLADTLIKSGVNLVKIFGPEHGFRGAADAGEKIDNYVDKATGVQVISLYGEHRKPTADDLKDVDVMLFDIQDVGVRFYTYISSLEYYIEAALENGKPVLILDRPNPNGFYVDGPVLDKKFKSFVLFHFLTCHFLFALLKYHCRQDGSKIHFLKKTYLFAGIIYKLAISTSIVFYYQFF